MKRTLYALGFLLAVQLLFAFNLAWTGRGYGSASPETPLIAFDPSQVDRIEITQPQQKAVVLVKRGQDWLLPDLQDFPVAGPNVELLLEQLHRLRKRLPITTSASAIERFKVHADIFERRIRLLASDRELGTLFLGNSPGFRRLHARAAGEEAVFEIEFNTRDASTYANDWINKDLLRQEPAKIHGIKIKELQFELRNGAWTLHQADTKLDQEKMRALVKKLAELRYLGVLGTEEKAEYGLQQPVLAASLSLVEGKSLDYRFGKPAQGDKAVLKTSIHPYYFEIANYNLEDLTKIRLEDLMAPATPASNSEATAPPAGGNSEPLPPPSEPAPQGEAK